MVAEYTREYLALQTALSIGGRWCDGSSLAWWAAEERRKLIRSDNGSDTFAKRTPEVAKGERNRFLWLREARGKIRYTQTFYSRL